MIVESLVREELLFGIILIVGVLVVEWLDRKSNKYLDIKNTEEDKGANSIRTTDEQIGVDKILKYICIQLAKDKGYFEDIKRQLGEWIAEGTTDINDPSFREKVDAFLKKLREDN